MTPGEMGACIAGFSRSGSVLQSARDLRRRPEHLFIQPEILGVVFGSLLNPTTLETKWARNPAYPLPTLRSSLQFSTPKGYSF